MDSILGIILFDEIDSSLFEQMAHTNEAFFSSKRKTFSDASATILASHGDLAEDDQFLVASSGLIYSTNSDQNTSQQLLRVLKDGDTGNLADLHGDWASAVWNKQEQTLTLINSVNSNNCLFYFAGETFFAFSTTMKPLLALSQVPKITNPKAIAALLLMDDPNGDETVFKGIKSLQSGHQLKVSAKGQVECRPFFEFDTNPPLSGKNATAQYAEHVSLFKKIIEERIDASEKIGLGLSGGLDSGAIASLAAPVMAERERKLDTFTFLKLFDDINVDTEKWYIDEEVPVKEIIEHVGNINPHFTRSKSSHHLDTMDDLINLGMVPPPVIISVPWLIDIVKMAQDESVTNLIIARMGNATNSFAGNRYGGLERIKRQIRESLPAWLIEPVIQNFRGKRPVAWQKECFLKSEFYEDVKNQGALASIGFNIYKNPRITFKETWLKKMKLKSGRYGEFGKQIGVFYGVNITDPTYDRRIVERCLETPLKLFGSSKENRLIIRKGFKGLVPDSILDGKQRGRQVADLFQRLQLDQDRLKERTAKLKENPALRELLDFARMESFLDDLSQNTERDMFICNAFLRALGLGLFLEKYAEKYDLT